jgi:hypothetical protein
VENGVGELMDRAGVPSWKLPQIRQDYQTGAAGRRLLANREASLDLAEGEAAAFIPNVEATIKNLDRTRFPNLNSVIMRAEIATGDPREVQAAIAIRSFVTAYARVLKPTGGVIGVEDMRNAAHLLDQRWSSGQMTGAIAQFKTELTNARKGLDSAKDAYDKSGRWDIPKNASPEEALRIIAGMETPRGRTDGGGGGGAGAAPPAAPGAAPAGGTAAPPSAGAGSGPIRWERGPDGVPRRVQ